MKRTRRIESNLDGSLTSCFSWSIKDSLYKITIFFVRDSIYTLHSPLFSRKIVEAGKSTQCPLEGMVEGTTGRKKKQTLPVPLPRFSPHPLYPWAFCTLLSFAPIEYPSYSVMDINDPTEK